MEKLTQPKNTPHSLTGKFMHPSQRGLKARLAQKTILTVNLGEHDYFHRLKKWLDDKGYFRKIDNLNASETRISIEGLVGNGKYDFVFLRMDQAPISTLEFARMVRELSKETKIILFFAGTQEEFERMFTGFEKRCDALYDSSQTDLGYPCLRGLLSRLTQPLQH